MSFAYDNCTDVLCIVDAQMLLSFILGIDVIMPLEFMSLLAWMTLCLMLATMFLAITGLIFYFLLISS